MNLFPALPPSLRYISRTVPLGWATFKIPEAGSQLVHDHFSVRKRVDATIIRSKVITGCQKDDDDER